VSVSWKLSARSGTDTVVVGAGAAIADMPAIVATPAMASAIVEASRTRFMSLSPKGRNFAM
jgi:hypothetical protein